MQTWLSFVLAFLAFVALLAIGTWCLNVRTRRLAARTYDLSV